MADKIKYIYGNQFAQKLPGTPNDPLFPNKGNYYFRTVTGYKVDSNGKPIEGTARTDLYYAPKPAARTSDGTTWTPGTADSIDNFNPGGWVRAGSTADNGRTYGFRNYSQEDADLGKIPPGKNVGDPVLGATAQQSVSTSGGVFYEAVQNNLINLAVNTQPGLAQVISAKQANAAQQQQQQQQQDQESVYGGAADITPIALVNANIDADYQRSSYGEDKNLRYPLTLDSSIQDCIQFSMRTNEGRNFNTDPKDIFKGLGKRKEGTKIEGTVTLPIQPGISDSNGVEWGGANMDAKDAYLASLALGGITSTKGLGETAGNLLGRVFADMKTAALGKDENFKKALNLYLAQEAVGVQGLLSRGTGAILNPNLELLFNGPTLRPFNFTFRLSPRSAPEAANVKRIIRFFKEGMSVKTASNEVFLKSPNVFDINYIAGGTGKDHPSLNRIKQCALLGCDVDYTPDGTYMTFNDSGKTMTSYQLTLRFSELEPIYSSDYKSAEGLRSDDIGF